MQKDIAEGRVKPGKLFILKFDFSGVNSSPYVESADRALKTCLSSSFGQFYTTYAKYLGGNLSKLCENINHEDPADSLTSCVLLINNTLLDARINGDKLLADVEGVNNKLLLI